MSSAPLRMVGAMVIEIGGVLLALALLPGLPWEQWKASIASAPSASAYEAAEFPPSLPPSRYGFQLDGQSRQLQERVYTAPAAPAAPQQQPFAAPPPPVVEDRSAVAEYLTRANYGLRIGNFELDYADGEVRYKSSLDFEGQTLTAELIRNAIYPAVHTMDRYLPGLLRVTFGGATPHEAIEEVEGGRPLED